MKTVFLVLAMLLATCSSTSAIDAGAIAGKWESFCVETVASPLPGISSALVIAGSDKRGTIYGIYDLSGRLVLPRHSR